MGLLEGRERVLAPSISVSYQKNAPERGWERVPVGGGWGRGSPFPLVAGKQPSHSVGNLATIGPRQPRTERLERCLQFFQTELRRVLLFPSRVCSTAGSARGEKPPCCPKLTLQIELLTRGRGQVERTLVHVAHAVVRKATPWRPDQQPANRSSFS